MTSLAAQIVDQQVVRIAGTEGKLFADQLNINAISDETKLRSVAFVFLVGRTILNLSDEEALDGLVDGGNDFGVDAIYYSSPIDDEITITLIQGKYKKKLDGVGNFPENGVAKMIDAIGALFDPGRKLELNPRLKERVEEVRSFVAGGAIPRVTAVLCNNGISWNDISQGRITNAKKRFGDQVEWRHAGPSEILSFLQAQKPIEATLQLQGSAIVEAFDFRRVLIGRMSVVELAKLVKEFGDRLLERNIWRYLGLPGNRVNEAVAQTLRAPSQRSNFYFYNNGITMSCKQFRYNALQQSNWPVQVSGLQIINGGQTSRTVEQIVQEVGPEVGSAQVLVRIYELPDGDDDLVSQITYATNSQNPVDLRDLRANDDRQKALALSIRELGFEYRTKREDRAVTPKELTSSVVAEAVLAVWRKRPHQARFLSREHFNSLYDIIFSKDLNGAQAIVAALLWRIAENKRKRPPEDAPDFLPYASRFIAMQMGQYLLEELGVKLNELDHRNFAKAQQLIDQKGEEYFSRGVKEVGKALEPFFNGPPRTLQRLSATFRRSDLVETLTGTVLPSVAFLDLLSP
jgi:AIPR protein